MSLRVYTQPTEEPVSVIECRDAARLSTTQLDTLIEEVYIPAARRICEQRTGRSLVTQTLRLGMDAWPADGEIELRRGPVQSVTSIKYIDVAGVQRTLATTVYELDADDDFDAAEIRLRWGQSWPTIYGTDDCIEVLYVAGYGVASEVPADVRAWILTAVAEMIKTGSADIPQGFCGGLLDRVTTWD